MYKAYKTLVNTTGERPISEESVCLTLPANIDLGDWILTENTNLREYKSLCPVFEILNTIKKNEKSIAPH